MNRVAESYIFTTFSREYLFTGLRCMRLRARQGGVWEAVLPNRLLGVVRPDARGPELVAEMPREGDRMCLLVGGQRMLTSQVVSIERAAVATIEVRASADGTVSLGAVVAPMLFWPSVQASIQASSQRAVADLCQSEA